MKFKLILILVLIGLAVLFIIQNVEVAEVRFLFWSVQMSRALLLFFVLAVGIFTGWFLHRYSSFRKKTR